MSLRPKHYSDQELLAGLRAGDNDVMAALYKQHFKAVLKFILNNSGSYEAAQDVYQEAIIVLYEKAKNPEFELQAKMQTFIYSVAKRLWLKQLRKAGKTYLLKEDEEIEVMDVSEEMSEHQAKEEQIEKMTKSLEMLGEPCSTLIKDFYVNKMSMEEIAEKFGYTNSDNAKTQKYKCLQRLKRNFFERNEIEIT